MHMKINLDLQQNAHNAAIIESIKGESVPFKVTTKRSTGKLLHTTVQTVKAVKFACGYDSETNGI